MNTVDASSTGSSTEYLPNFIAHFEVLRKLGEGGMGVVYLARNQKSAALVALKVLSKSRWEEYGAKLAPHVREDLRKQIERRFRAEPFALSTVQHPGLVACYEAGLTQDAEHYIAMEFVAGEKLHEYLRRVFEPAGDDSAGNAGNATERRRRRRRRAEVARLGHQIAVTLAALHERGIVHRDVKPDNILVAHDPFALKNHRIKLLDVGIAKLPPGAFGSGSAPQEFTHQRTGVAAVLGTPFYMAPEQWGRAGDVTAKADVYALGMTFYELLCGIDPDDRPTPLPEVCACDPDIEPLWSRLIEEMTQQEPEERPDMATVAGHLQRLARLVDEALSRKGQEFAEAVFRWEQSGRRDYPAEEGALAAFLAWSEQNSLTQAETEFLAAFERKLHADRLAHETGQREREQDARKTLNKSVRRAWCLAAAALLCGAFALVAGVRASAAERRERLRTEELSSAVEAIKKVEKEKDSAEKGREAERVRADTGAKEQAAALSTLRNIDEDLDGVLGDPSLSLEDKTRRVRAVVEGLKSKVSGLVANNTLLRRQRDTALDDKKSADEARAAAERDKKAADEARAVAERDKKTADDARAVAERDRRLADDAKVAAEKDKKLAERAKIAAEREKRLADDAMEAAEQGRALAESTKAAAEKSAYDRGMADGKRTCPPPAQGPPAQAPSDQDPSSPEPP